MWKLLTGDGYPASRTALIPHAVSATVLLFVGLLVVGLAQMGGGSSAVPSPRFYSSSCYQSTSATFTPVANKLGYYTPTTATVWRTRTVTKTVTRTVTVYRTRTKTVCRTTTVTEPGSTTTETVTVKDEPPVSSTTTIN